MMNHKCETCKLSKSTISRMHFCNILENMQCLFNLFIGVHLVFGLNTLRMYENANISSYESSVYEFMCYEIWQITSQWYIVHII